MNKKIQSFFSKFKFKWWSWELDAVKIVPAILILLTFLPVLPHEKKNGKLNSVIGVNASVNNFYFIGFENFSENHEIKPENPLYDFSKLLKTSPYPDLTKHKKYLLNQGTSEELATCIILRDSFFHNFFLENELRFLLNAYAPSPVPIIWITRLMIKSYIESHTYAYLRYENYFKLVKRCSTFKNIAPPKGYLENDFSYQSK